MENIEDIEDRESIENIENIEDIVDIEDEDIKNVIKQISIDYLINNLSYKNKKNFSSSCEIKEINNKDKKFYKKRILHITKEMLNNIYDNEIKEDVLFYFNKYINVLIKHYKIKDKNDILQEEYKEFDLKNDDTIYDNKDFENNEIIDNKNILSEDNYFLKHELNIKNNKKKYNLDNFVIIKKNIEPQIIMPIKRIANIKNPILKTKGLQKKCINDKSINDNSINNNSINDKSINDNIKK